MIVLGYLPLIENIDPEEAIFIILANRSDAVPDWEAYHSCRYDLVEGNRRAIEIYAYKLYEQGLNISAEAAWQQAKREILRNDLLRGRTNLR